MCNFGIEGEVEIIGEVEIGGEVEIELAGMKCLYVYICVHMCIYLCI